MKIVSKVNGLIINLTRETEDVMRLEGGKYVQAVQDNDEPESPQAVRKKNRKVRVEQETEPNEDEALGVEVL